ncbi:MAG: hypothetical protein AMJ53_13840 [Gammaproteobacteria bacterium SG8_11]|nr:MAG: hypothetical protein AMJ53_13840 [Gammaproteobacteria bacterium SG8_11]
MRFTIILCAAFSISGCASLLKTTKYPPLSAEQQAALEQRRQSLADVAAWDFSGRLSLKTDNEAWTGKVRWRQSGEEFRLHFNSPTGQGAMQLMSNAQFGVEMRVAEGGVYYADDAESLLYDHTGWRLPVSGLRLWVMGLPEGNREIAELLFDDQGRIQSLQQYQWRVQYGPYQQVQAHYLPRKITLQNNKLNLRIVIDHWEIL